MKHCNSFSINSLSIAISAFIFFFAAQLPEAAAQTTGQIKISVQAQSTAATTQRPPTRTGAVPEVRAFQGVNLRHSEKDSIASREVTARQLPGTPRPASDAPERPERKAPEIKALQIEIPQDINSTENKSREKNDPPVFYSINVINGIDVDGDGYFDAWDFEVDIDPLYGTTAYDVWITIQDNYGNEWANIGPFDFTGQTGADNVIISDFDALTWGFDYESMVYFTFYADNLQGSDVGYIDVPVDIPADWPQFYEVNIVNTLDEDNNGYYEMWDFDVDIDPYYGGLADDVYIEVWDDEGNAWGPFVPYDFSGYTSNDNVLISDFGSDYYNFNFPENVNFTFRAYNAYDDDQMNVITPVDKLWDYPEFYDVYVVNESDMDNDGYFDAWDFEIDIDALNNLVAEDVYIDIQDDEGNSWGPFGPYDFVGQNGNDNLTITDFTYNSYSLNNPENVNFTFIAYNTYGSDQMNKNVPVDTYFEAPVFYEVFTTNTIDNDNDNYLEQWDFEIDIDALYNGVAEDVYVEITDDEGNNWGTYGPYTFEGETSNDNVSISSWYMDDYGFENPENVQFSFYAYNAQGSATETLAVPVDGISSDATLSQLKVNNTPVPGFNPNVLNYTYDLPYGTTIVPTVSATANHQAATVEITQATNLYGTTQQRTATVEVTAEDGTTTLTYSIIFNVLPPNDDATLSNLQVSGQSIPGFNPNVLEYNFDLPYGTTATPVVTATPTDPNATVQITPATNVNGTQAERTTTALVTAEDGTTTLTYSIIFNVLPPNDDATLSNLQVSGQSIPGFNPNVLEYNFDLPYGTTATPVVTATPTDPNATVQIIPATNINGTQAERTTTALVTAEDGTTTLTYSIIFNVLPPNDDATLSDLLVDGETINGFAPNTFSYIYNVAYSIVEIPVVAATPTDANAAVQITHATSLTGTQAERTTTVLVTAEDGVTTLTYEVVFNKLPASTDASLADLTVDGETVQGFHPSTINYVVDLWHGSEIPVVIGTPNHEFAEVIVQNATNLQGSETERTATIEVTAEDGQSTRTYTILFNLLPPNGIAPAETLEISMYPNPVSTELTVAATGFRFDNETQIQVVSSIGNIQPVEIVKISDSQIKIPVNRLQGGVYFLIVKTNEKHFTKQFVVIR